MAMLQAAGGTSSHNWVKTFGTPPPTAISLWGTETAITGAGCRARTACHLLSDHCINLCDSRIPRLSNRFG